MLVLQLNHGDKIKIYDENSEDMACNIMITESSNLEWVKIAFSAPKNIKIVRESAKKQLCTIDKK